MKFTAMVSSHCVVWMSRHALNVEKAFLLSNDT
jgi:hypothetical protein